MTERSGCPDRGEFITHNGRHPLCWDCDSWALFSLSLFTRLRRERKALLGLMGWDGSARASCTLRLGPGTYQHLGVFGFELAVVPDEGRTPAASCERSFPRDFCQPRRETPEARAAGTGCHAALGARRGGVGASKPTAVWRQQR